VLRFSRDAQLLKNARVIFSPQNFLQQNPPFYHLFHQRGCGRAILWFFRNADDEKLKRNEEEDRDPCSKPALCLSLRSFFPCNIGLAEEP